MFRGSAEDLGCAGETGVGVHLFSVDYIDRGPVAPTVAAVDGMGNEVTVLAIQTVSSSDFIFASAKRFSLRCRRLTRLSRPPYVGAFRKLDAQSPSRTLKESSVVSFCVVSFSVDSLAQSCGLSLPTFNQRGWFMTLSIHAASSLACIASRSPASPQYTRVDFLTRYCGLSLPTLFERIGIMASDGQPLPTSFYAARVECARRPELALGTGAPSSRAEVRAGLPVKTTPTGVASGPAGGQAAAIRMSVGKTSTGHLSPAKTTPTAIASGTAQANSPARLDNRKRMVVAKPSSRPSAIHPSRRRGMSARAGPFE